MHVQRKPAEIIVTTVVKDQLIRYSRDGHHNNTRCIIFVHGVTGDIVQTWRKKEAEVGFVELVATDDELQDYDVYAFGYYTKYYRGPPIDHAAIDLDTIVSSHMPKHYDSIVLVAHSMGGLVCMKYIVDKLQGLRERDSPPPISGLLLYGTPNTGSDLLKVARLVGYGVGIKIPVISHLIDFFLKSQRQLVDLETGSEFLTGLFDQWALRVVNGGHEEAGSQRMWLAVRVVTGNNDIAVSEASGKGVYGAIDWKPLQFDHIQLVKPAVANDRRYLEAKDFFKIARRTDPDVLNRVWKACQDTWDRRFGRVSKDLEFFTEIDLRNNTPKAGPLSTYGTCSTICEYRFILGSEFVDFGISFAASADLWARQPAPVYIHQVGLNLLPQAEQVSLRRSIESILANGDDAVWATFFPRFTIRIDGVELREGKFDWPTTTRKSATWLLRRFYLPRELEASVGTTVTLKIEYDSVVPSSVPHFSFSAPWIVHKAKVDVVVKGEFEYFVPSSRLVPAGKVEQAEEPTYEGRRAQFSHDEIMLPGSEMMVRWRLKDGNRARVSSRKDVGDTS